MALKPFTKIHDVTLSFQSTDKKIILSYNPEEIINDVVKLICRAVVYMPCKQTISLSSEKVEDPHKMVLIHIHVTGVKLNFISQITQDILQSITLETTSDGGTIYTLERPFEMTESPAINASFKPKNLQPSLPRFYAEIRKHLQSHFTKADKILATLSSGNRKMQFFFKKSIPLFFQILIKTVLIPIILVRN